MIVRYIGAVDEVITILPGDPPVQLAFKRGEQQTVTKAQALVLLAGFTGNPYANFEPVDKAALALVAAPVAEEQE